MSSDKKFITDLSPLLQEANLVIKNQSLIDLAKKAEDTEFAGVLSGSGDIENILNTRKFTNASSFYGHMYGKNISACYNVRPQYGMDLFVTDDEGILKNTVNSKNSKTRIKYAIKNNIPLIYIFGGSTAMSIGSRTPEFSIPSLIERSIKLKFNKEIVCINFSQGGTSSQEALNIMIHKAFKIAKPNSVIFYDGWNCSTYLMYTNLIKKNLKLRKKINFINGENIRNIENTIVLGSAYDLNTSIRKSFTLIIANFFAFISRTFKVKILSDILNKLQSKFLNLQQVNIFKILNNELKFKSDSDIKDMIPDIVSEYIENHKLAFQICKSQKINFFWSFQPLIFYGEKKLNDKELSYKLNCKSSIFNENFYKYFYEDFKNRDKIFEVSNNYSFCDLSYVFENVSEQTYLDSGHLNRLGNLIISSKIADELNEKNAT
mgnify:CR=1 FL=1|tara:strand:+ start:268 stop:1566 length:1299 start_codon:yes stop_codon:yes gene_type:complete